MPRLVGRSRASSSGAGTPGSTSKDANVRYVMDSGTAAPCMPGGTAGSRPVVVRSTV